MLPKKMRNDCVVNEENDYSTTPLVTDGECPLSIAMCARNEALENPSACHNGPTGDIMVHNLTAKKIFDLRYFWPITIYKDAHWSLSRTDDSFQLQGKLPQLDYLSNGLKRKRSPPMDAHSLQILNLSSPDLVLPSNHILKIFSGKLKSRWNGPFTITRVFPYGTVELSQANGPNFKVNGHRVKHYFGGNVPHLDCPDCEDSQFCHSSRVSHPQLHLGIRYPNLID
ncbi:hypothetical protein Tco_0526052 [Tanacetum coccineum]